MSTATTLVTISRGAASAATGLAQRVQTMPSVCPVAPPGMTAYQDQVIGWVKWGVIAIIIITALVSLGAIGIGKIFAMPHASSRGAIGVAVAVMMAILFVTILGVISGVIGSGC